MNITTISKEINSPALKEVVKSLYDVMSRIQGNVITHQQGATEITAHKHIIQSIALDWAFNRQKQGLLPVQEGE